MTNTGQLTGVKRALKLGEVIWLHGVVEPRHWHIPRWVTQCCRLAHRAGVPWTLMFTQRPWKVKPFDALRKLRYVQVTQPNFTKSALWMSSDKVRQRTSSLQDVVAQITSKKVQTPWTDTLRWLSEEGSEPNQDGLESREQRRIIENGAAVGGLRSPHESIRHLPRAEQVGDLIKKTLDEVIDEQLDELTAAVATLGTSETPLVLKEAAQKCRQLLAPQFQAEVWPDTEGLQGNILHQIAQALGDPDELVRKWLDSAETPLGIEEPIQPGGVFPPADQAAACAPLDGYYNDANYSSFDEDREGAEANLQKEPALTVGGTEKQRTRLIIRTALLWLMLGLRLAWMKGARGRNVEWIGARVRPWQSPTKVHGVTIGITPEQVAKLAAQCEAIWEHGAQIPVLAVRQLAGLASWISSLMPQVAAYTAMLWAAAASARNNRVANTQIWLPITWLQAFCQQNLESLERHCRLCAPYLTLITFDGSLMGGGATLQVGIRSRTEADSHSIVCTGRTIGQPRTEEGCRSSSTTQLVKPESKLTRYLQVWQLGVRRCCKLKAR